MEICALSDLAGNILWNDLLGLEPHQRMERKTEIPGTATLRDLEIFSDANCSLFVKLPLTGRNLFTE